MMRSALAGACFGSALALAAAAGAQTLPTADAPPAAPAAAAPAAPVPATGCELHIWPTERFLSRSSGFASLLGGGLLPALIDRAIHRPGDRDNREQMRAFLDSADQTSALAVIDPQIQLFLPNYRLVPHEEPLPADQERPRTRYAASSSPCYAELIVTRLFYSHQAVGGGQLQASFLYRDFGPAAADPRWTYAGSGTFPLHAFPPSNEGESEAANMELRTMFQASFEQFARDLVHSRRRHRRRGS